MRGRGIAAKAASFRMTVPSPARLAMKLAGRPVPHPPMMMQDALDRLIRGVVGGSCVGFSTSQCANRLACQYDAVVAPHEQRTIDRLPEA